MERFRGAPGALSSDGIGDVVKFGKQKLWCGSTKKLESSRKRHSE